MGTNSYTIVSKNTTIEAIIDELKKVYGEVKLHPTGLDYAFMLILHKPLEEGFLTKSRDLWISYNFESTFREEGILGVSIHTKWCGKSVELMTRLAETFGGYVQGKDTSDDYIPVNEEKFLKASDFTPMESFRQKAFKMVGLENLEKFIELCEEYRSIKNYVE